jgi:hypothetical protein
LKDRGSLAPGFLSEPQDEFPDRSSVRWHQSPRPGLLRLVVRYVGQREADADHLAALVDAAARTPSRPDSTSEIDRLRAEIAQTDGEQLRQERAYLDRRVKELKEEVRLQELTTPTASQLAALRQAAAKAAADHRAAIEARIRDEVVPAGEPGGRNDASESSSTRQSGLKSLLSAESAAAERKRNAELRLREAEARVQQTDAARTELRAAQARLNSVTATLGKQDQEPAKNAGVGVASLRALPPERVQIVARRDLRGLRATAAGLATAFALGWLLHWSSRKRLHDSTAAG